jgi:transposase
MAKKGRRATSEEQVLAVQLMESGRSPDEVAEILGVGRSSVFDWQKKYREGGLAALSTKFASGRPTVLSDKQMVRLYSLIVWGSKTRCSALICAPGVVPGHG